MDLTRTEIEYSKIKNLNQYKNFSEEKLRRLAYSRAVEYQVDIETLFKQPEEQTIAKSLLRKYLDDYIPETVSDINTLRSILFLEVLNGRLQDELNTAKEAKEDVDLKAVETIHKNLNQILILKDSLGLTKDKKSGEAKEVDKVISNMRKQFSLWEENNQASREAVCPYCKQQVHFHIRTEYWEIKKHPFFKDRILFSKPLVRLYLEKKLTKAEVAEILECSPDYIDWLVDKMWKTNPTYQELESQVSGEQNK
jgi:hypothetical protein